jgi:hypothetical protein
MKKAKRNPICRLQGLPKRLRLFLAAVLTGSGLVVFLTPLPGGIVLISTGLLLACCTSDALRAALTRRLKAIPPLAAILTPMWVACEKCSKTRRPESPEPAAPLDSTRPAKP